MAKAAPLSFEMFLQKLKENGFDCDVFPAQLIKLYRELNVTKAKALSLNTTRDRTFVAAVLILGGLSEVHEKLLELTFDKNISKGKQEVREATSMKVAVLTGELLATQVLLSESVASGDISELSAAKTLKASLYVLGCYGSFLHSLGVDDSFVDEVALVEMHRTLSSSTSLVRQLCGEGVGAVATKVVAETFV